MSNLMDLKKHLNKIRDILRTVGVTDSDSISHCIALIVLRRLTTTICKQTSVPETYAFRNFKENLDDEELRNKFYMVTGECFVYYLRKKLGYDSFKFKTEIGNLHFRQIFTELEKINFKELHGLCDVVGTIYELHLSTGAKSSRDLGQYFTNRLVIKFMIDLVKPVIQDNGQVETIVDPTMGTGGFLTMAIEYLNKKGDIDWNKNKKRVFGYDIASQLKDMATINLLLETGKYFPNLQVRDTLSKDMCIDDKPVQYDVILANEPMGLKGLKYANFCDRIKDLKIKGTKAEPAFLQLFMQSLNIGGRCAVIVPDGVLFSTSRQHLETRQYLIENYEVGEIIKMNDKNFFMNTGVSASIIFFANPEERERDSVIFSEICLNKDQTEIIYKEVSDVNYETIAENGYSLNPNIYQQVKIEEIEGYEYKTLGDICEFRAKSKRSAKYGITDGLYPFFKSSLIINSYVNDPDYIEPSLIIGDGGEPNINYAEKFSATDHCHIIAIKSDINVKYIYHYIRNNLQIMKPFYTGTGIKNISRDNVKKIIIPIPPLKKQQEIVEKMDVLSESNKSCQTLIGQLKKTFNIEMDLYTRGYKEKKTLGEICEYEQKKKKFKAGDGMIDGQYKFYTSSDKVMYINEYEFNGDYIVIGRGGKSSIHFVSGKFSACHDDTYIMKLKNNQFNLKYIYYFLYSNTYILDAGFQGSTIKHTSKTYINTIKLPMIPLKKQNKIVTNIDTLVVLIQTLERRIEHNEYLMKKLIK
jgi:type I restriction-modification system DNA methylase subunit